MCTVLATTVPYTMATELMSTLTGVAVSKTAAESMIETRANYVAMREATDAQTYRCYDESGLEIDHAPVPPEAEKTAPKVAYLEMDGVFPMTREEVPAEAYTRSQRQTQQQAKADKIQGGKARRYTLEGREVKNAVFYTGEACAKAGGRGCLLEKQYVSYLGNWKVFALLVWVMMRRLAFDRAQQLVILSDGAQWIRSFAQWLPIKTFLILDLYHVKHRIWTVANALYGAKTEKATRWAKARCAHIDWGRAEQVIACLNALCPNNKETAEKVSELADYLSNNLDRMDYPRYRTMGLRVGSGAIESANYHVTGTRLKLQGMRWSEQGARDMAFLRAELHNGRWERTTKELLAALAA